MTKTLLSEQDTLQAAEYALGVMQGAERDAFAKRIASNKALAEAVRQWDENFVNFADDIAPEKPPLHIEAALEKRLFAGTTASAKTSLWNSVKLWRGLAIASLAAILALGAWNFMPRETSGEALVAQVAAAQGELKLIAYFDADKSELRLNRTHGGAHAGRSLELWLIAGDDAPVSLGILPDTSTARMAVPSALHQKFKNGVLAISDEPKGGSPTGAPTGDVLATGSLTEV